jgi:hypothetical protein
MREIMQQIVELLCLLDWGAITASVGDRFDE